MKILIADDDQIGRMLLRRYLESMGHEIVECSGGQEVMDKLAIGELPQLAFLDWMMPDLNGIEICRLIRQRPNAPFIYLMLLTNRSDKEDIVTGLRAGANDYLSKTCSRDELLSRLEVAKHVIELHNLMEKQQLKMIAASKMAALGEMASGIAHEINNPLTIIRTGAGLLASMVDAPQPDKAGIRKLCDQVSSTVTRIAQIINGLRAFAHDEEHVPADEHEIAKIIEETVSFCRAKLENQGVALHIKPSRPGISLRCRAVQISQVLLNLFYNAYHAVEPLEKKWIEIEVSETPEHVIVSVTDSGRGIPAEIREKIMQPFFTTKPVGQGTGLGLSISKGIVESHQGELKVDETCPHTRFVLTLSKAGPAEKRLKAA